VTEKQFKVLLAGIGRGPFEALAPVLDRQKLDVERVATPEAAIEFASLQPVDLVVFDAEPNEMRLDEIVAVLRAESSASAKSSLLVMAERGADADARALIGHGVNRVMFLDDPQELIEAQVVDLLDIAPRAAIRFAIRLYTSLLLYGEGEEAVRGDAEIVRHAVLDCGGVEGVGVRFLAFKNSGRELLDAVLADALGDLFEQ